MSELVAVKLIPVGSDASTSREYDLADPRRCEAMLFRSASEWTKAQLEIKWNAEERYFYVSFQGRGRISVPIEEVLSKRIPLQIANSSKCECGGDLALGDYRIVTTQSDFLFEGDFFCPKCKAHREAKTTGFRYLIQRWVRGLKKIEIKADGVGLERE